jgi:Rod binding domain-containing protein
VPKIPTDPLSVGAGGAAAAQSQAELAKVTSLKDQGVKSDKQIDKAASGFEALLLHQMMKSMWQTVEKTGFLGDDSNEADIMRDMFTQSVSDEIAKGKGIGVKEVVKREIQKQEPASDKKGIRG